MECGSSSAGGGGGGVVLRAAQEPRRAAAAAEKVVEEEKAGGHNAMKFRVCARAPHGVGALLLIGGAAALGAAVVAWRHARRAKDGAGQGRHGERPPAKEEALNGGAAEDEKVGASAAQEVDLTDENLSREKTETGSNGLGDDRTEESQQIHEDTEIVADDSESEPVETLDHKSTGEPTEISMHDVDGDMAEEVAVHVQENDMAEEVQQIHENKDIVLDESESEPVEKSDHSSTRNLSIHDVGNEHVEKSDNSSRRDPTEISMHFVDNVQVGKFDYNASRIPAKLTTHDVESESMEKVDSIENDIKKEMSPNDNDDVEISDQNTVCIKGPGIALHKHSNHSVCTQEPESMENTPTAQLIMHQEQLLDDMMTDTASETAEARSEEGTITDKMDTVSETLEAKQEEGAIIYKMDTVSETVEAKPGEGTNIDKNVSEQEEKKARAGAAELVGSPALSSLVKPTEKTPLLGQNEMGMKLEQDRTNGVLLKEHGLIKGGATQGGALMTMDRRSASMAILALVFAMTIGITVIMSIYAPLQAT